MFDFRFIMKFSRERAVGALAACPPCRWPPACPTHSSVPSRRCGGHGASERGHRAGRTRGHSVASAVCDTARLRRRRQGVLVLLPRKRCCDLSAPAGSLGPGRPLRAALGEREQVRPTVGLRGGFSVPFLACLIFAGVVSTSSRPWAQDCHPHSSRSQTPKCRGTRAGPLVGPQWSQR